MLVAVSGLLPLPSTLPADTTNLPQLLLRRAALPCMMVDAATKALLRREQDEAVARRAERERALLQPGTALVAKKQKGGRQSSGAGFGSGAAPAGKAASKKKGAKRPRQSASKAELAQRGSVLAKELQSSGVVRIDGALSAATADALRDFVDAERLRCEEEVEAGGRPSTDRFANLVLLSNRCGTCAGAADSSSTA